MVTQQAICMLQTAEEGWTEAALDKIGYWGYEKNSGTVALNACATVVEVKEQDSVVLLLNVCQKCVCVVGTGFGASVPLSYAMIPSV